MRKTFIWKKYMHIFQYHYCWLRTCFYLTLSWSVFSQSYKICNNVLHIFKVNYKILKKSQWQWYTAWKVSKYGVFFWSVFYLTQSEYGKIRIRKNSIFGHFSHTGYYSIIFLKDWMAFRINIFLKTFRAKIFLLEFN